jgi:hypothetical protein
MLCSPIQSSCALRVNPSVLANPIPFPALLFVFLLPQIQQIRGRAGLDSLSVAATDSSEPARWRMHPGRPLWSPSSTGARSSRGGATSTPIPTPSQIPCCAAHSDLRGDEISRLKDSEGSGGYHPRTRPPRVPRVGCASRAHWRLIRRCLWRRIGCLSLAARLSCLQGRHDVVALPHPHGARGSVSFRPKFPILVWKSCAVLHIFLDNPHFPQFVVVATHFFGIQYVFLSKGSSKFAN